jgi:hypothetical protein
MAYTSSVPQAGQQISQTQQPILDNFAALASFGNGYAEMAIQIAAPSFTAGNDGLYTLNYTGTSTNELFVHRQGMAGITEVPFTASKMSNNAAASCDNGWSYLPTGMLMKWGSVAAPGASLAVTPTATSGGPNFSRVFVVYLTAFDSSAAVNFSCGQRTVADNTSGNFDAYCQNPSGTTAIRYLVLGI